MPLSPKEQQELEELEYQQLLAEKSASAGAKTPSEGAKPATSPWEASVMMDAPESLQNIAPAQRSAIGRTMADMALEGGGGAVGQAIGAIPAISGPTLGLSVPIGGFVGGASGNALKQYRQLKSGERSDFSLPEALGAGAASVVPGSPMAGAGVKTVAKEGVKQGLANLAGMGIESYGEKRAPTLEQAALVASGGLAGAGLAKALDTGAARMAALRKQIDNTVANETLFAARQAGYKVAPSQLTDAPAVAKALEWLAGGSQTVASVEATARRVNLALARKAIGMGEFDVVNLPALEAIREAQGKVYAEVANVSPRAETALQKFKEARDRSRAFWMENEKSGTVASGDAAREWDGKMKAYQKVLDKELKDKGRDDLIPAFQKARETIAKTHLIEDAFNEGNGAVMGDIIVQRRKAGKTITTGELEVIADFAQGTGISGKIKRAGAVAHPFAAFAATSGALYGGGAPHAMAAGATALAAPMLAKKILLSDSAQNQLMIPKYSSAMPQDLGATMASLSAMSGGRELGQQAQPRPVPYR